MCLSVFVKLKKQGYLFLLIKMTIEYLGSLQLLELLQVTSWTSCSSKSNISFHGTCFLLFTHFTLYMRPIKYRYYKLHILLHMTQTKAYKGKFCESLKDGDIIKTKAEKENTSKEFVWNICGIYFMYKQGLFDTVLHCGNNCTFSLMFSNHFFENTSLNYSSVTIVKINSRQQNILLVMAPRFTTSVKYVTIY